MPDKKKTPVKSAKAKPAKVSQTKEKIDKNLNLDQLSSKIRELRGDLIRQLNQIRAGASNNVRRPRHIRRQIARHLTVANSKRRTSPDQTAQVPPQTPAKGKKTAPPAKDSQKPKAKPKDTKKTDSKQ